MSRSQGWLAHEQGQLFERIKATFAISDKQIKPLRKGKLSPVWEHGSRKKR